MDDAADRTPPHHIDSDGTARDIAGGDVTTHIVNGAADPALVAVVLEALEQTRQESERNGKTTAALLKNSWDDGQRRDIRQQQIDRERLEDKRDLTLQFSYIRHQYDGIAAAQRDSTMHINQIADAQLKIISEQHAANRTFRTLFGVILALMAVMMAVMIALIAEYLGVSDAAATLALASAATAIYYVSHR